MLIENIDNVFPSFVPTRNEGVSPEGRLEEILLRQCETGGGQGWGDPKHFIESGHWLVVPCTCIEMASVLLQDLP